MELMGTRLDMDLRQKSSEELEKRIIEGQKKLDPLVGHPLNPNSPKQMREWLYGEMGFSPIYKRGTHTVTADEEALMTLRRKTGNKIFDFILDIREARKTLKTWVAVDLDADERLRTSYAIEGTVTGRLASRKTAFGTGTNLQNVPKGMARKMFIPDPGKLFIGADLEQAEARVVAWLAADQTQIQLFDSGMNIHKANAAILFNKSEMDVTKDEYALAKRIIHASNYLVGANRFAMIIGKPISEAKDLIEQYFRTYPMIRIWHLMVEHQLKQSRTLETPMGRRRYFFGRWGQDLLRQAVAFIPQSTVADVLNYSLARLATLLPNGADILLQIHDAVVVQCPEYQVPQVSKIIKACMEFPMTIHGRTLTIPVSIKVGENWNEVS